MSEASGDRIILEGMQFYGYHGRNDEERVLGQPFEVDLEAELDLTAAGVSDDIEDSVSYTDLYRVAKAARGGAWAKSGGGGGPRHSQRRYWVPTPSRVCVCA